MLPHTSLVHADGNHLRIKQSIQLLLLHGGFRGAVAWPSPEPVTSVEMVAAGFVVFHFHFLENQYSNR